jgi:hypothetical protein
MGSILGMGIMELDILDEGTFSDLMKGCLKWIGHCWQKCTQLMGLEMASCRNAKWQTSRRSSRFILLCGGGSGDCGSRIDDGHRIVCSVNRFILDCGALGRGIQKNLAYFAHAPNQCIAAATFKMRLVPLDWPKMKERLTNCDRFLRGIAQHFAGHLQ